MTARVLLLSSADPRCRSLERLLTDLRTVARALDGVESPPWNGPPPDLLVVGALGATEAGVGLVRSALSLEPLLSVLVMDDPARWPEALHHLPGVGVVAPDDRAGFTAERTRLLERRELLRQVDARRAEPHDRLAAAALDGDSPAVREMRLMLDRQRDGRGSIVVAGERGTLRTRILNHVVRDAGRDDETLLVEQIDDLSPSRQGEVLRRLKNGHRLAATATGFFRERVRDGSFRRDLYYALGGVPVETVPLRERAEDIERLAAACGLDDVDDEVQAALRHHPWRGNLRQLEIVAEQALMLAGTRPVEMEHVLLPGPAAARIPPDRFFLQVPEQGVPLEQVEKEVIRQTLDHTGSNITEAARRLEIERGKLRYRLRRYGLGR